MRSVAIVGMGCRFAGAWDLHAYWALNRAGRDAFGPIPIDRWPADAFLDDNPRKADKIVAHRGGFIEDVQTFPALALGLPPRRVEVMDPQQRLSLEVCLQAIEDAGRAPSDLPRKTGVFIGLTAYEYKAYLTSRGIAAMMAAGHFGQPADDPAAFARAVERVLPPRPFTATGALGNMSASIVTQELDLHGPAYTVDAACASALVAVDAAVAQLRAGTIDAALAGGAYTCLMPDHYLVFSRIGAMSPSGRCLPFDARADGFVQGDGAGAVLLKRLDDALRDGDRIYAVIHGAATNNDGRGEGPMAPRAAGQAAVVRDAWADAGLDPAALGYVEAHGTGTTAGDATELEGLHAALGDRARAVALGSSKANVGHTMSAAGIAGLIRAALALHHETIPPMANFGTPKPGIGLDGTRFRVPSTPEPWRGPDRLAAVSSFGFGGTNAHLVLGTAPQVVTADALPELVLISAADESTLRDLARRTGDVVAADPRLTVAAVARAWARRAPQPARLALVASTRAGLVEQLAAIAAGERPPGTYVGTPDGSPRIAFLYPGQGSQRIGMLADPLARFPILSEALDQIEASVADALPLPLTHLLYPERRAAPVDPAQAEAELTDTATAQPVLLGVAIALTRLLDAVGVRPAVVAGHSLGELTAAAVAGVLSPAEAARFVARRGRAMAALPGDHGAMAAMRTDADAAAALLVDGAVIANVNHPRQVVVSGATAAVAEVVARATAAGIRATPLAVSHGFHSPTLAGLDVATLLADVALADPRVPVASGIDPEPYRDAAHARDVFVRHATSPVLFTRALQQCRDLGADLYLQVGAGGPLASFARGTLPHDHKGVLTLASLDDHDSGRSLLETLAQLWTLGVALDPRPVISAAPPASVPPVVLRRERYWAISDKPQRALDLAVTAPTRTTVLAPEPESTPKAAPVEDLSERVFAVLAKVSAYPRHALRPSMTLMEDLGFDSLMVGDLAAGLSQAFPGLPGIPQELLINRPTVDNLVAFVRGAQGSEVTDTSDDTPLAAYAPIWRPAPLTDLPERALGRRAVLVVGTGGPADALSAALVAAGHRVHHATAVDAASAVEVDAIAWCAALDPTEDAVTRLVAALGHQARHGGTPDLLALLRDGDPHAEGVAGVARSVAREWPDAVAKCVVTDAPERAAALLLHEWVSADRTTDVRYVGERAVLGLTPLDEAPARQVPTARDTILITGGTRGIGAKFAGRLVDTGARLLLLGRGAPGPDAAALLTAHPDRVAHLVADVTDAGALRAAIAPYAPITMLVHAAGALADGPLGAVDLEVGRAARAIKVGGWRTALAVCGPALRVALGLGSWAGRFGNRHQADYAAANALLASLATSAPAERAVVAELGPWSNSEMARTIPAPAQAAMRADGVDFVGDRAGLDALWDALTGRRGVVLYGRDLPATTRVVHTTERLAVATHPFLADHAIDGVPVWPLASALDAVARLADLPVPWQVEDLQLFSGVTVREPRALTLTLQGERAEIRLGDNDRLAYRARVRPLTDAVRDPGPRQGGAPPSVSLATFYRDVTFHGPLLQGITAIEAVGDGFVRGRVRPLEPARWGLTRPPTVDPLAVDSAMQLSAYVAHLRLGRTGTPVHLRRYVQLRPFPAGELSAEVRFDDLNGDRFTGSLWLRDAEGRLVAVGEGLVAELRELHGARPAPEQLDPSQWPEVRALHARLNGVAALGLQNPYFQVHQGTARDTTRVGDRELINFSSYNYLGLSGDARVVHEVKAAVDQYGTSVSASRVASGERPFHRALERALADAQGVDDALVFTAGHATNVTTLGHIVGPQDLVLHDALIHDSILQGIRLSGAARRQFRHEDPEHLDQQLSELRGRYRRVVIAVEGVYSMDGDLCDLPAYVALKERHGCLLFVDEAHSFGVVGSKGRGIAEHHGVDPRRVDLWMGTLSKSLASCGGWVGGSEALITWLRYTAPGFVYSAGLTAANGVAALAALRLMGEEPWRVADLQRNATLFQRSLADRGVDTGPAHGQSGVVPVITGNSAHALHLSARLHAQGVNVQPIVYPAVAEDAARLRFFLSATHTEDQLVDTAVRVSETLDAIRGEDALSGPVGGSRGD